MLVPDSRSVAFATGSRTALKAWKTDPVFQPYFHETDFIVSGHTPALTEHIKTDSPAADVEALVGLLWIL
ncbi:hypothetical protein NUU61_000846 [Penicillium alfredii]|uniref:Uncharacterized protein n=1 Tax=Penicillium alfredii TaxID=1506179 RepID=A0A9W9GBH1_9EURO|nr:uncharacterized protein NUU61_000846 [Penicillium alfredii]KAJ5115087.1 hypothetical protein NUU61_000846 [Penicillium alfredii]